ncbi:hypothetical protein [Flavobacterium sp.]|uniref:hypothetical protein n=1 Tax=Flavobacterium sp. TaxID=239 RepID=UPI0035AFF78D
METKTSINHDTLPDAKHLLGDGIIFYDGKYRLAEKITENGWFCSPIYETENGLEVRPAGGNWASIHNGAVKINDYPTEKKKQVYKSWINHLEKSIKFISKHPNYHKSWTIDWEEEILFWRSLLNAIA